MKINIIEYLDRTVNKVPGKTAVIDGDRKITFGELVNRSKWLSFKIFNQLFTINNPIAVFLPKSIESILACIAITYSGN